MPPGDPAARPTATDVPPLVLLDLDGTLTESGEGIMASSRVVFETLGLPVPTDAALRTFIGPPLRTNLEGHGVPADRLAEGVRVYRRHYTAVGQHLNRVYDGVPEALAALRDAGLTLALATSKLQHNADAICDRLGLTPYLAGVWGDPDPDRPIGKAGVIGRALADLGPRRTPGPRWTRMVGDRLHDVEGAAAHGLACLGAGWGYGPEGELVAAGAESVVATPAGLPAAVLASLAAAGWPGAGGVGRPAGARVVEPSPVGADR
ncbi:HAD hydrolase-like protein [Cellulomonas endophytica]|uniref:HAD hydrolase-like protein n=1 Tax=Cellulomonas endophytica TaxID=2494735 RepID=UPI001F0BF75B|nr:HAD hydrolase-like protein [Cellulomonas endophytica]